MTQDQAAQCVIDAEEAQVSISHPIVRVWGRRPLLDYIILAHA